MTQQDLPGFERRGYLSIGRDKVHRVANGESKRTLCGHDAVPFVADIRQVTCKVCRHNGPSRREQQRYVSIQFRVDLDTPELLGVADHIEETGRLPEWGGVGGSLAKEFRALAGRWVEEWTETRPPITNT